MSTNDNDNENDKTRLVNTSPTSEFDDATVFVGGSASTQSPLTEQTMVSPSYTPPPIQQSQPSSGRSGKQLINNRFELTALLGSGGMGSVYKAIDQRKVEAQDRDPYVALKLLNEDFKQHPNAFVSLQRESRKSQNLAHPNIVTVYDFDRDGEMVFMTMEYMEGAPLDEIIRRNVDIGLEYEQACKIFKDISEALAYAHSKNIIHSDFKPGNIFVTKDDIGKVFDFGIARAVSTSGVGAPADGDKTYFDAGALGALTPAYASYEMLKGQEPSTSDDVYALACVCYELFAGRHPFNKTPADKAAEQKLKPARIKQLSKRQWKALEKALSFHREKRTQTVKEFEDGFFSKSRLPLYGAAASLVVIAVSAVVYQQEQSVDTEQLRVELEEEIQVDLRANIEHEVKQKALQEDIQKALENPLSENWRTELENLLADYKRLAPKDSETVLQARQKAMSLYLQAATVQREQGNLQQAQQLLDEASTWQADAAALNAEADMLASAQEEVAREQERQRIAAEQEAERLAEAQRQEQLRIAKEKKARELRLARERKARAERLAKEKREQQIEKSIAAVQSSLQCSTKMDVSGALTSSLDNLKALSAAQYQLLVPGVQKSLSSCINQIAKRSPVTASKLKSAGLKLFPSSESLSSVDIDYCAHLRPGSGSKGRRYFCSDKLSNGQSSPTLVVAKSDSSKLAVTRYEITTKQYNQFCRTSGKCAEASGDPDLPVSNINIDQARKYASWLSQETGYDYRLPRYDEWMAVASAQRAGSDPDRNCYIKFGGLQKGTALVKASSGKPNDNGLINHVGNVREWTFDSSGELLAVGGSRKDPLKRCLVTTKVEHSGQADDVTGFRLVRNIR